LILWQGYAESGYGIGASIPLQAVLVHAGVKKNAVFGMEWGRKPFGEGQ
jgi:hypothetical protein